MNQNFTDGPFCGKCTEVAQPIIGYKSGTSDNIGHYLYSPTGCTSVNVNGGTIYAGLPGIRRPKDGGALGDNPGETTVSSACRSTCAHGVGGDRNRSLPSLGLIKERGVELYENYGMDESNRFGDTGIYGPSGVWGDQVLINDYTTVGTLIPGGYLQVREDPTRGVWYQSNEVVVGSSNANIGEDDTYGNPRSFLSHRSKFSVIQDLGRKVSIFGNATFSIDPSGGEIPTTTNMQKYYSHRNLNPETYTGASDPYDLGWQGFNTKVIPSIPNVTFPTLTNGLSNYPFLSGWYIKICRGSSSSNSHYEYFGDSGIEISIPSKVDGRPSIGYRLALSNPLLGQTTTYTYSGARFYLSFRGDLLNDGSDCLYIDAAFYKILQEPTISGVVTSSIQPRNWTEGPNGISKGTQDQCFAPVCPTPIVFDGDSSFQSEVGIYGQNLSEDVPPYISGSGFKSMYIPPHMEITGYQQYYHTPTYADSSATMYGALGDDGVVKRQYFTSSTNQWIFSCTGDSVMYHEKKSSDDYDYDQGDYSAYMTMLGGVNSEPYQTKLVKSWHSYSIATHDTSVVRNTSNTNVPYFSNFGLPSKSFLAGVENKISLPFGNSDSPHGNGAFLYLGTSMSNSASCLIDGVNTIDDSQSTGMFSGYFNSVSVAVTTNPAFVQKYVYGTNPTNTRSEQPTQQQSYFVPEIVMNPKFAEGQIYVGNSQSENFNALLESLPGQMVQPVNVPVFWENLDWGPTIDMSVAINEVIPLPTNSSSSATNAMSVIVRSTPSGMVGKALANSSNIFLKLIGATMFPMTRMLMSTQTVTESAENPGGRITSVVVGTTGLWSVEWTYVLFYCAMNGPVTTTISGTKQYNYENDQCKECSLFYDPLNLDETPIRISLSTEFMQNYCGWRNLTYSYAGISTGLGGLTNECQCMVSDNVCAILFDGACSQGSTPTVYVGENMYKDNCQELGAGSTICIQQANQTFYATGDANQQDNTAYIDMVQNCGSDTNTTTTGGGGEIPDQPDQPDNPSDASTSDYTLFYLVILIIIIIFAILAIVGIVKHVSSKDSTVSSNKANVDDL